MKVGEIRTDLTELEVAARITNLIKMDEEIRELGDEDLMMVWLVKGVPDEAGIEPIDYDILRFMATYRDEEGDTYDETVKLHAELMTQASEQDENEKGWW
jgi:hypothetical protein